MPTLGAQLAAAAESLAPVTETPRLDAELLMARALGVSRATLLTRLRDECEAPALPELLGRRLAYEPMAYILGTWEFFSLEFIVEPPMLVPRPETEHLVEAVLEESPQRVLDLCTGTGCVAVAVAVNAPQARVTAVDISPAAVDLARRNAKRHGVGERVNVVEGDLFEYPHPGGEPRAARGHPGPLPTRSAWRSAEGEGGRFDVICANPPYVEDGAWAELPPVIRLHEDPGALLAGLDGLALVRRILADAPQHLRLGGLLAFEIGMGQYDAVQRLAESMGYVNISARLDLAGIPRIVTARLKQ